MVEPDRSENNTASEPDLVVSAGDSAGISPELIPFLLSNRDPDEVFTFVGPPRVRDKILDDLDRDHFHSNVQWIPAGSVSEECISSGEPNAETGEAALTSFRTAMKLADESDESRLLTLPLSKQSVQASGHDDFIGHTEELERFFDSEAVMSFFGEDFNVALFTRHCPVHKVREKLSVNGVKNLVTMVDTFFRKNITDNPCFAVLGLNPHAGEGGSIGTTDETVLKPAVEELQNSGLEITGPHPADSFLPGYADEVDMIFASYHDQGLVPFKQEYFHSGVHASLGLPVLRVSPDHGVAADLAGTGRVNPGSTIRSLEWIRNRNPVR